MPLQNGIFSIIHAASDANLTGFTYAQVYAGAGASPTINGTTVTMAAGSTIDVLVRTISSTANVFVIGDTINTTDPGGTVGIIL